MKLRTRRGAVLGAIVAGALMLTAGPASAVDQGYRVGLVAPHPLKITRGGVDNVLHVHVAFLCPLLSGVTNVFVYAGVLEGADGGLGTAGHGDAFIICGGNVTRDVTVTVHAEYEPYFWRVGEHAVVVVRLENSKGQLVGNAIVNYQNEPITN